MKHTCQLFSEPGIILFDILEGKDMGGLQDKISVRNVEKGQRGGLVRKTKVFGRSK